MQRKLLCLIGLLGLGISGSLWADDPFSVEIAICESSSGTCDRENSDYFVEFGSSNAEEVFDAMTLEDLRDRVGDPNFSGLEEVIFGTIHFRGVDISLDFPDQNGERLVFNIDDPDFRGEATEFTFGGSSASRISCNEENRSSCVDALKRFVKANEGDIVSELYRLLAMRSSVDPIAGNPGSMQSQAAQRDYEQGFSHKASQVWGCSTSAKHEMIMLAKAGFACTAEVADANFRMPAIEVAQAGGTATDLPSDSLYEDYFDRIKRQRGENKATIGLQYAMISASDGNTDLDSTALTLPLSYTVVFDEDPKRKLIFRLPVGLTQTEDADTVHIAFSVGYSHPMTERWSLTPSAGYSVVGSEDLGAASALASFSLTSSYALSLGSWSLNIGNMIGNYSSQKFKVGDYESDPGISNTVITNGLMFSGPNSLLANDLVVEYFINDTRYSGDDLFTDNAQEIGFNLGRISTQGEIITSYVKAGLSYMTASGDGDNEADVLRLSLVYKF